MNLAITTCAVFPSEEEARQKLWIFLASCQKFGIDPMLFGMGRTFPGYRTMGLEWQLEFIKTIPKDYSHVLFTDGWDAFFTAPKETIIRKYQDMGSPEFLCSAFYQLANVSDMDKQYPGCFDTSKRYCFPNRGGYIGERQVVIDALERMLTLPNQTGDECFNWYDAIAEGWFKPTLDSGCSIFQIAEDDCTIADCAIVEEKITADGKFAADDKELINAPRLRRLYNVYTGSLPCVWHHSGGYTDQVTGKDARMIPWAQRLGIIA